MVFSITYHNHIFVSHKHICQMTFKILQEQEKDECFKVELTELSPGAKMGRIQKTIVTIVNDDGMSYLFITARIRSMGKVMFSHASVILSRGGCIQEGASGGCLG